MQTIRIPAGTRIEGMRVLGVEGDHIIVEVGPTTVADPRYPAITPGSEEPVLGYPVAPGPPTNVAPRPPQCEHRYVVTRQVIRVSRMSGRRLGVLLAGTY